MKILKGITNKKILYLFTLLIIVFLPILKQISFYLVKFNIIGNHDDINPIYLLGFCIPFLMFIYIRNLVKTKRKIDICDYLFYILVIVGIIVSLFSIDKQISFLGKVYRHEGFISLLSYYLLFITWKVEGSKEDIKKLIKVFTFMALLNSIYAVMQIYTPFKYVLRYSPDIMMASGISGNPNFFGSLIVTVLGIITSKFLLDKKVSIKIVIILILLFISLVNSQSTGPFLAYIITILFLIIYLIIKKKIFIKNIILLFIIFILTCVFTLYINKNVFNIERCELCDFVQKIVLKKQDNTSGEEVIYTVSNGRMDIWKNSINIVKDNLITGVGYDNFHLAYYKGINLTEVMFVSSDGVLKAIPKYSEIVDNAHNVYLHTFVTSGLLGLLPYLVLCLLTFIKALKTKNNLVILLLGGFVAYSIQAFANISVVQVAPIYFVIIGLILSNK